MRLCASLFRRLSVSFRSASDQDLKAAKYVVLIPGPGMFVNVRNAPRVVIAPSVRNAPVSACKPLCARLGAGVACVPDFIRESECGPFVREVENAMKSGLEQHCGSDFLAIFA